jgi:hypothetical protein
MVRLLKWLVVLAALAAVVAFLPIGGRTVLERWHAAKSPAAFAEKSWHDLKTGAARLLGQQPEAHRTGTERSARAPRSPAPRAASRPGQPVEHHSQADREAIDEIVAKHVN